MSYIEQTRKEIIEAYVFLRNNNMTIPSETLEFMKDSSLKALDEALNIPVVVVPKGRLCEHNYQKQKVKYGVDRDKCSKCGKYKN